MTAHLQGSLFDQTDQLRLGPLDGIRRTVLGVGAWIDVLPGWLSGSDALFEQLAAEVPWRAERRTMYDHVVDVPRLLAFYGADDDAAASRTRRGPRGAAPRTTPRSWASPSPRPGSATTATAGTASPGTATGSGGAPARTPWSRSSPWARPATWCCDPCAAAPGPYDGRWDTAT